MVNLELIMRLPLRPRAALALWASGRAVSALRLAGSGVITAVDSALALGWRWVAGETIAATQLYDSTHELLRLEPLLEEDARGKSALFAAVAALYYVTWHADGRERATVTPSPPRLPNDMAELGEEFVTNALAYAADATNDPQAEAAAQRSALDRLLHDYSNTADELGPAMNPEYFRTLTPYLSKEQK